MPSHTTILVTLTGSTMLDVERVAEAVAAAIDHDLTEDHLDAAVDIHVETFGQYHARTGYRIRLVDEATIEANALAYADDVDAILPVEEERDLVREAIDELPAVVLELSELALDPTDEAILNRLDIGAHVVDRSGWSYTKVGPNRWEALDDDGLTPTPAIGTDAAVAAGTLDEVAGEALPDYDERVALLALINGDEADR